MRGVLFSVALVLASGVWVCVSGLAFSPADEPPPVAEAGQRSLYRQEVEHSSLAYREETDFLLVPALLVQQQLQDGAVVTYPVP